MILDIRGRRSGISAFSAHSAVIAYTAREVWNSQRARPSPARRGVLPSGTGHTAACSTADTPLPVRPKPRAHCSTPGPYVQGLAIAGPHNEVRLYLQRGRGIGH
jgi:hypothetical protein